MANNTVGSAVVTITMDLAKFASEAKQQITQALSSSTMRDAVTSSLEQAASNAGVAGQSAASKFATGVTDSSSKFTEAGTKSGQAVTEGISSGLDGAASVFSAAGERGGSEFASAVATSASGAGDALAASVDGDEAAIAAMYDSIGEDAGTAFSDGAQTAIEAGAPDVADAASAQGDLVDDASSQSLAEAGASSGDSFIDAGKESLAKMATEISPVTTAEAAKVGTAAGEKMAAAGAEAGGKFTEGATESLKGLASSLGPAIGVLGAGELVKSSLEAADQLEGANIKIENVFGESGDAVKTWAAGVSGSLRLSTVQAEGAAGQFGAYLSGLGVGKDQAAGLSEQLVGLAGNIAAFNNADPATVQAALTSALRGRTTALKQYGVTLTDAQVQQEAMTHASELGLTVTNGTIPTLNTQQKALATLYAVMDATKNQQGALAATSDTVKAKTQIVTAEFSNMRAELGTALMPILASLFGFLANDVIPALEATGHWVSQNSEWLKPLVLIIGAAVAGYKAWSLASGIAGKAQAAYTALTNMHITAAGRAAAAEEAKAAAMAAGVPETEAAATAQTELDEAMDANPIGLIVAVLAALALGLYEAWEHSATFRKIVLDTWKDIKTAASDAWNDVLKPTFEALETAGKAVWSFMQAAWNTVGKPIWEAIKIYFGLLVDYFKIQFDAIVIAIGLVWDLIKLAWTTVGKPVFDLISDVIGIWWNYDIKPQFDLLVDYFELIWTLMQGAWNDVGKPVFDAIEVAGRGIGAGLKWAYDNVLKPTGDLIAAVWSGITDGWNIMVGGLGDIGSAIETPVKAAINGLISIINDVIGGLDKISVSVPDWSPIDGGKKFGINIDKIPSLALGGTIQPSPGGTLVRVAEAGRAETVVDTGDTNKLIRDMGKQLTQRQATQFGQPVEIHEHIYQQPGQDPASLAADASRRVARQLRGIAA